MSDLDTVFLPIKRFALAINASGPHVRALLDRGVLAGIKDGARVKVTATPREYLESRPAYQPGSGTMKPGPGRGHRRQPEDQPSAE
ncbi:MAG TPA: hypothetical protein VHW66_09335 [Stellaceae bacterium]|jgi:hypothetical protein|nr:hypothetical protein [Stellaceae bacterium]